MLQLIIWLFGQYICCGWAERDSAEVVEEPFYTLQKARKSTRTRRYSKMGNYPDIKTLKATRLPTG